MLSRVLRRSNNTFRRYLSSNTDEFESLKPVKPPVFLPGDAGKAATNLYVQAVRAEQLEQVVKDMETLAHGKAKELDKFVQELDYDKYSMSQLQAVVTDKAVAAKFSKVSAEYYASLVKKGTTSQLPAVAAALQELFLVSKGFDIADVTSAVSLSKQEQQDLEAAMSKEHAKTGRKLHFRYAVNPTIMGGFTIQINEHFWDLSIETQVKNAMAL